MTANWKIGGKAGFTLSVWNVELNLIDGINHVFNLSDSHYLIGTDSTAFVL